MMIIVLKLLMIVIKHSASFLRCFISVTSSYSLLYFCLHIHLVSVCILLSLPLTNYSIAGLDYTAVSSTVTFQPNELSKTVQVSISDDSIYERKECFVGFLSNPVGGEILPGGSRAEIFIEDSSSRSTWSRWSIPHAC